MLYFDLQSKEDLQGDEEHSSGSILADRSDGEIISEYANFIWQLHHDKDKASSYFKRALQASPEDRYSQPFPLLYQRLNIRNTEVCS